jgi:hypothetical protein
MSKAPSVAGAKLLGDGLLDGGLARRNQSRFHLHRRRNPCKVFVHKEFLDNAVGKHVRCNRTLRAVRGNRRDLLPHIG